MMTVRGWQFRKQKQRRGVSLAVHGKWYVGLS